MTRRYRYIMITIIAIVFVLSLGTSVAYLLQSESSEDIRPIGKVEMTQDIFHINKNNERVEVEEVLISPSNGMPAQRKPNVYNLNVSNPQSDRYVENIRVNFNILSNVETYFRVKVTSVTTLTYESNNKDIIEVSNILEKINYNIFKDEDEVVENPSKGIVGRAAIIGDWYYDVDSGYYYYKHIVDKDTPTIEFIEGISDYIARPPNYIMQFNVKYEAVQAIKGPEKVWGLNRLPWLKEGES